MPIYRLRSRDGTQRQIQATRVVTDGVRVCFETWARGAWQSVAIVPVEQIRALQRRVNELNGTWGWIRARPEPAAGRHPHQ